jgi:dipeptidase D
MSNSLQTLEPKLLWKHFGDICAIPHPSKHEQQIAQHLRDWAKEHGFETVVDAVGSMVIQVPATPGHEGSPTVVLQGHMDMVCEKNSDVQHDCVNDPIKVKVDGDWVKAEGTTLGADNGVGLAAAMAIAEDSDSAHGPLELLCTVDEETGLTGAKQLDPSLINGRILLNLDTEEDGAIYIGCAGGADSEAVIGFSRRKGLLGSVPVRVAVRGLRGGHSGLNIIENRANAIKLVVRLLFAAIEADIEVDLVSLDGGSKHNAIPRECFAVCRVPESSIDDLQAVATRCLADFLEEFSAIEPDMEVVTETIEDTAELREVLNVHARDRILMMLDGLPHGVLSMSREVPGLVESSSNLAVVKTEAASASFVMSHRSSIMPTLFAIRHQVASICKQAGAEVTEDEAYPGWKPNPESPLVKKTAEVYEKLFGSAPAVKAIHAGLECGLILEKVPDMDAVSIGPEIRNAHSPDEMVQISSVQKFYEHLKALIVELM